MGPEAALAVCRFAHDASTMLLWGTFGYLATLVPRDLATTIGRRLDTMRIGAVLLAVGTTVLSLPVETATIGNGWGDALDLPTLGAVLFETRAGTAWQAQAVAALLLAGTLVAPARSRSALTAVASGLLLATLALTGHAAMHGGWLGTGHRLNDVVHVLAGGAWVGALVPLLPILAALGNSPQRRDAGVALRRFSSVGHAVVALVIATGVVNTALILGRWPTTLSSPYQALLDAKLAVALLMTTLAVVNRYGLVPRIAASPSRAIRAIRLGTMVEIGLGAAAVGCVSVFGLLEPA